MTRKEMLKQMGLTHEELKELLLKLAKLRASLNDHQRAVLDKSLPAHVKAAKTFGVDVTAGDLQELLDAEVRAEVPGGFIALALVAFQNK